MKFKDVTDQAGVGGGAGYGLGVCAGDYDNDGYQDLFVSNYGENILYHNNGDGTFTDVTRKAGVARGHRVGAGACFLDYDNDGHLDLFAANYVKFSEEKAGRDSPFAGTASIPVRKIFCRKPITCSTTTATVPSPT